MPDSAAHRSRGSAGDVNRALRRVIHHEGTQVAPTRLGFGVNVEGPPRSRVRPHEGAGKEQNDLAAHPVGQDLPRKTRRPPSALEIVEIDVNRQLAGAAEITGQAHRNEVLRACHTGHRLARRNAVFADGEAVSPGLRDYRVIGVHPHFGMSEGVGNGYADPIDILEAPGADFAIKDVISSTRCSSGGESSPIR